MANFEWRTGMILLGLFKESHWKLQHKSSIEQQGGNRERSEKAVILPRNKRISGEM